MRQGKKRNDLIPETGTLELALDCCALPLCGAHVFTIFILFSQVPCVIQISSHKDHFLMYCFYFNNSMLHWYEALERVILE